MPKTTEDLTAREAADARRRDRLRGWRTCKRCGVEYHSGDGHGCRPVKQSA